MTARNPNTPGRRRRRRPGRTTAPPATKRIGVSFAVPVESQDGSAQTATYRIGRAFALPVETEDWRDFYVLLSKRVLGPGRPRI